MVAAGVVALFALLGPAEAGAQVLGFGGSDSDEPIEIYADEGIEWQQERQVTIARGNARAIQGNVSVNADTLTAYYRKRENGGTEIWRVDADGKVHIASPRETAYGDKGVYDVDNGILVLTGAVRFETPTDVITARDSLEYWEKRRLAVARGQALAVQNDKRLRADVLTAHLRETAAGKTEISRIDALGNVHMSTPTEIIRGERGVYDVETGIATLVGSVRITRGKTQLNGERAIVDTQTGVSHLLSDAEKGGRRVRGLIQPESVNPPAGGEKGS